ncbi:MAG TPA: phosphoribosyltransferase family protein [Candidatus Limnocylindria bacterium]|nr:phosphoribosyltransferase family protein [Candidatus Limnocylindria bacterium]
MTAAQVLDAVLGSRCAGCDRPGAWFCLDCRDACEPVRRGRLHGASSYGGPLARAVRRFKYKGERALAAELGALVAARVAADLARGVVLDVVVPAVLHEERARDRGYDQARLLAAVVAERTGLAVRAPLRRIRVSRPQVDLDRVARAANVRGAFVAEAGSLRGLRVALVDDVATTGATLAAASGALRAAGAREVRWYVVALDE